MFGGYGIYRDDVMFGIVAEGSLYLKADDENRPLFEQAGCVPFCYYRKGRNEPIHLSYYEAPPEAVDRAEALRPWADHALAAARRTNGKKRR